MGVNFTAPPPSAPHFRPLPTVSRRRGYWEAKPVTAQTNEVLCKILAHNLIVLVHAMHELGIEPDFATVDA